jgi:hypothetical protein
MFRADVDFSVDDKSKGNTLVKMQSQEGRFHFGPYEEKKKSFNYGARAAASLESEGKGSFSNVLLGAVIDAGVSSQMNKGRKGETEVTYKKDEDTENEVLHTTLGGPGSWDAYERQALFSLKEKWMASKQQLTQQIQSAISSVEWGRHEQPCFAFQETEAIVGYFGSKIIKLKPITFENTYDSIEQASKHVVSPRAAQMDAAACDTAMLPGIGLFLFVLLFGIMFFQ